MKTKSPPVRRLRAARRALLAGAFVLSSLAFGELVLRFLAARSPHYRFLETSAAISQRTWLNWLVQNQTNFLLPPFRVFANTGLDDERRLRDMVAFSKLPPGETWTAYDFLQTSRRDGQTVYHARSNALGYRDPERAAAKPRGVYRIIALGACQTFGHGVEDDETYPRRLEAILNARFKGKRRFEVWNGGRQAATAVTALARLRFELPAYHPDMLILDFSHTDVSMVDDEAVIRILGRPWEKPERSTLKTALRALWSSPVGKSYLLNQALNRLLLPRRERSVRDWEEATRRILRLAEQNKIPVILLDQRTTPVPPEVFDALARETPGVSFLSLRREFPKHPPAPEQVDVFRARYDWTAEFGGPDVRRDPSVAYYLDLFFPNPMGYELLANLLADRVQAILSLVPRRRPAGGA